MISAFISLYHAEIIIYVILLLILQLTGGASNILIGYVIQKKKRLRNIHNTLIQHLCLSNLITCSFPTTATIAILLLQSEGRSEPAICYVRHVTIFISLFANFWILTALSLEKHDNIVSPFRKSLTKTRLSKAVIGIWVATILGAVGTSIEYWKAEPRKCFNKTNKGSTPVYYVLIMTSFGIMFLVSLYCYIRILMIIKSHSKAVQGTLKGHVKQSGRSLEKQPAKMVAIFIFTFVILWLPTGIVRIIRSRDIKSTSIDHIYVFTGILMYFAALCHPLTCMALSRVVREQIKLILGLKAAPKVEQREQHSENSLGTAVTLSRVTLRNSDSTNKN